MRSETGKHEKITKHRIDAAVSDDAATTFYYKKLIFLFPTAGTAEFLPLCVCFFFIKN